MFRQIQTWLFFWTTVPSYEEQTARKILHQMLDKACMTQTTRIDFEDALVKNLGVALTAVINQENYTSLDYQDKEKILNIISSHLLKISKQMITCTRVINTSQNNLLQTWIKYTKKSGLQYQYEDHENADQSHTPLDLSIKFPDMFYKEYFFNQEVFNALQNEIHKIKHLTFRSAAKNNSYISKLPSELFILILKDLAALYNQDRKNFDEKNPGVIPIKGL